MEAEVAADTVAEVEGMVVVDVVEVEVRHRYQVRSLFLKLMRVFTGGYGGGGDRGGGGGWGGRDNSGGGSGGGGSGGGTW